MTSKESVPDDGVDDALALVGRRRPDAAPDAAPGPAPRAASGARLPGHPDAAPSDAGLPDTGHSAAASSDAGPSDASETGSTPAGRPERHRATPWPEARTVAGRAGAEARDTG
ncbi:hypothetical protein ABZV60_35510, partial [Streptomyces sp. NPDC004787]